MGEPHRSSQERQLAWLLLVPWSPQIPGELEQSSDLEPKRGGRESAVPCMAFQGTTFPEPELLAGHGEVGKEMRFELGAQETEKLGWRVDSILWAGSGGSSCI